MNFFFFFFKKFSEISKKPKQFQKYLILKKKFFFTSGSCRTTRQPQDSHGTRGTLQATGPTANDECWRWSGRWNRGFGASERWRIRQKYQQSRSPQNQKPVGFGEPVVPGNIVCEQLFVERFSRYFSCFKLIYFLICWLDCYQ